MTPPPAQPALSPATESLLQALVALDGPAARAALRAGADALGLDEHLAGSGGLIHRAIAAFASRTQQEVFDAVSACRAAGKDPAGHAPSRVRQANQAHEDNLLAVLRTVLRHAPDLPLARMSQGFTPVHDMAHHGQGRTLALLVACGAPLAQPTRMRRTVAHLAAMGGHVGLLRRLANMGLPLDTPDQEGATPAHLAASAGLVVVLRELKRLGADMGTRDAGGLLPVQRLLRVDEHVGQQFLAWERRHEARLRAQHMDRALAAAGAAPSRSRI